MSEEEFITVGTSAMNAPHFNSFIPIFLLATTIALYIYFKVHGWLQPYRRALFILLQQGLILNQENTSPFSPNAPWKRLDLHHVGKEDSERLGGVYIFKILWFNFLQVADPWLMAEVLDVGSKHPDIIDKPRDWPLPVYNCFDRGTSVPPQPSLISAETVDPLWKTVRRNAALAFNPANLRKGFPIVLDMLDRLVERLGETGGAAIDIDEALQCQAFDVIGSVGFGHDFRATEDFMTRGPGLKACRTIKEACSIGVKDMQNPLQPLLRHVPFLPEKWNPARKGMDCERRIISLMRGLLITVLDRGPPEETDCSIAAQLVRTHGPDGQPLPFARLWSELSITFMAGMETTAHTVTWALYLLSQHPEVEAKVVAELDAAGLLVTPHRPNPRQLDYNDLNKLTYLSAVLKESMRLYSTAPMVLRVVKKDVQLGRYFVPAGTFLCLHVYAMHNISHNWERHDEFLPERFLESGAENARTFPAAAHPSACQQSAGGAPRAEASTSGRAPAHSGGGASPGTGSREPHGALWGHGTRDRARGKASEGESGRVGAEVAGGMKNETGAKEEVVRRGPVINITACAGGEAASAGGCTAPSPADCISRGVVDDKVKRFMPFLDGNRQCVGMALARVNYTATLATLLSRFSFRLAEDMGGPEGVRRSEVYYITVQPKDGLRMHCIPRPSA